MKTSESIANLAKALAQAQAKYPPIPKNRNVSFQLKTGAWKKYDYADLADVMKVIQPVLGSVGLSVLQTTDYIYGPNDKKSFVLITRLVHETGEFSESIIDLQEQQDPKDFAANLTYKRRYQYCTITGCQAEEDPDSDIEQDHFSKNKDVKKEQSPLAQGSANPLNIVLPKKETLDLVRAKAEKDLPQEAVLAGAAAKSFGTEQWQSQAAASIATRTSQQAIPQQIKEDITFKVPNGKNKGKPITELATDEIVEMVLKIEEHTAPDGGPEKMPEGSSKRFYQALKRLLEDRMMVK